MESTLSLVLYRKNAFPNTSCSIRPRISVSYRCYLLSIHKHELFIGIWLYKELL